MDETIVTIVGIVIGGLIGAVISLQKANYKIKQELEQYKK